MDVEYNINRDSVQQHLCQTCLASINSEWFGDDPPAEIAVVSYEDKSLHILTSSICGFSAGNYHVDCEYREDGDIDLLIFHYPLKQADEE